ncbi:MOSC domain-containing protein [Actinomycetospora sp. OC33-EN08]|uniref:MOSC domain-containing protein n=1 Tax=Actinomycetospora aurantiaca TaxID=3129233 RepID=A0ABU8MVM5_9PSEU
MQIERLVVSPGHAYQGRPSDGPAPTETTSPSAVELRAGHGVVGDRYAGRAAHRDAALTIIAAEALEAVAAELGVPPFDPVLARRTVVTRGLDVERLRMTDVLLDSGDGPVLLGGRRPAAPCAWMDTVLAPGAHALLRGRAGVRFAVLGSGVLRVGPLTVSFPTAAGGLFDEEALLDPERAAVGSRRRQ